MPELKGAAKDCYVNLYGEERYRKYINSEGTTHGGVPPPATSKRWCLVEQAVSMPFFHRWAYGAESVFWTMYATLLRALPMVIAEGIVETETTRKYFQSHWKLLYEHTLLNDPKDHDSRALIKQREHALKRAFPPVMADVAGLLFEIISHVEPAYALMSPTPPHEDHPHEAMRRLILQYLVDDRDNPILLTPG
ncbi:hypothetical protein C8Q79DRAFT_923381 [Trametes meyenii]|nr:hypothetical protein C8Q79DRAFT_923381 [Trametes meyenii]